MEEPKALRPKTTTMAPKFELRSEPGAIQQTAAWASSPQPKPTMTRKPMIVNEEAAQPSAAPIKPPVIQDQTPEEERSADDGGWLGIADWKRRNEAKTLKDRR